MIDEGQLQILLADLESFRVERTISTSNSDKFREAICAFSNDMPGSGQSGYLLIGADDKTGRPAGIKVTDQLLQQLNSYATDGNILPPPALAVYKIALSATGGGDIAVVEVLPSDMPPVRYKGRVYIRTAPQRGIANETQERILTERRLSAAKSFDAQPCLGSTVGDLSIDLFLTTYRTEAIAADVLAENHRKVEEQMASLRLFDLNRNCPTTTGILLFAKDPLQWLHSAYIQYVRFDGPTLSADPVSEKRFSGDLITMLRTLDSFVKELPTLRPVTVSALREEMVCDFPPITIRELLMNAVMHRSYSSQSPIRFYQFTDHIEITSPGPLYGEATPANFPRQTSYRNPVVAEAMKTLGFVNQFGRGVQRAQDALAKNNSPYAKFEFGDTFFGVNIPARS
jgi:ATP-dependent DNA helicase RecG